jgi:RND family efflux transporter MFP subunit
MKQSLLIIFIFFVLSLSSCGRQSKDKEAQLADLKKQQSEINQRIEVLESQIGSDSTGRVTDVSAPLINPKTFTSYVEVQGTIDADENVMANAEMPGIITAIYVVAGQQVKKGQILAQLDDKVLQQQILQVHSQVDLANSLFQRQKNLWNQKIGTEVQFLQAQNNRDVALKQLSGLKAQSSMYKIISPINGVLDQMDLKVGQAIQPGIQGIRVVNLSKLKVKADVAESYSERVKQGDRVIVTIPGASDSLITTITYASRVIEPTSRSYTVEVKLPTRADLKPNMTAVLRIVDYEKKNAIVLPIKAIHRSEVGEYVFVAKDNVAKRIPIKIGNSYQGSVEVVSGIAAGDQVVIEGTENIEEGDQLRIAPQT